LTIEILFVIGTGLIKVSILLFFRRLGSRGVTKTFRVITWVAIGFTIASTITFFISPLVGCRPLSGYWEQSDVVKIIQGTKFNCNDEGAAITAAGVVSTVQDVIAALLEGSNSLSPKGSIDGNFRYCLWGGRLRGFTDLRHLGSFLRDIRCFLAALGDLELDAP
jgi:hypothetical protein